MSARWFIPVAVALVILGGFLFKKPRTAAVAKPKETSSENHPPGAASRSKVAPAPEVSPTADQGGSTPPTITRVPAPAPSQGAPTPSVSTVPPQPEATPLPQSAPTLEEVREDIDNVQFAIRDYRTALGENPIGTNAEITKALNGDNLKQVRLSLPQGSSLNENGEMCDRWGSPYFFHQLSKTQMEIYSAGADRKMWSEDDIVVK